MLRKVGYGRTDGRTDACPEHARFFCKNPTPSVYSPYGSLISCKKSERSYDPISIKSKKKTILGTFGYVWACPGRARFFCKILPPSFSSICEYLTSCKKSEQSYDWMLRKVGYGRTDGLTDGRTDACPEHARFFCKNPTPSVYSPYGSLISCKKSERSYDPISIKSKKKTILGTFGYVWACPGRARFFCKILPPSFSSICEYLTSCKKSEQSYDWMLRKVGYGRTDGLTDELTDGLTDGRTDGRTDLIL